MLTQPQLIELARRLHLELDISRLHAGEMESTIRIYQAGLVLSGAHSRKQQKQLHGHEEKAKKKKDNMPIKIDSSKGRIISSEEAEQYELARIQAEAQKVVDKQVRIQQRKAKRDARDAEQTAKKASREADKATKDAVKLQKEAEKLARQWRREEDKKVYANLVASYSMKLAEWEEKKAKGVKACGRKPAKPKMPKVQRNPLTEDELSAAKAAVMVRTEKGAGVADGHEVISEEAHGDDPDDDDDDESDSRNFGLGNDGDESEELVDLGDFGSFDEESFSSD
jgi:hypothetical protein